MSNFKISLGVKFLDEVLSSAEDYVVLLYGPVGSGKSLIVKKLAEQVINSGKEVVYSAFEEDPRKVKRWFAQKDTSTLSRLKIVNYFSDGVKDPDIIQGSDVISDLRSMVTDSTGLIIVDSMNELTLRYDVNQLVQLIKGVSSIIYGKGALALFTYNSVSQEIDVSLELVKFLFDGLIQLNVEPIPNTVIRSLRIERFKGVRVDSGWYFFAINEKGDLEGVDASSIVSLIRSLQSQQM
ncbi:MAG: RAD55 family ATPase [Sulfolobales archaeon]|nr:RAD55 family ATPase [Sulfolobales archaeon]